MPRARPVQTPGATPADAPETPEAVTDLDVSDAQEAAKPKATKAAKAAGDLTAADYAGMHSSEVDATKLKKSVLCKDGWVVPDLPPQAPVRA